MNLKIKRGVLHTQDYLLAIFLTSFIVTRIIVLPSLIANMVPALFGFISYSYVILKKKMYIQTSILIAIILSLFMILAMMVNQNCDILDLLWIWSFMGVAMLIYSFELNSTFVLAQYYAFALFLFYKMISAVSYTNIIVIGSENNISVYLLLYFALYLLIKDCGSEYVYINYLHIIIGMIMSIWSASRAGTLTFGLGFVLLFIYNSVKTGKKLRSIIMIFLIILIIYFLFDNVLWSVLMNLQNKVNNYGTSSLRTVIWEEYCSASISNVENFLFGPNTQDSRMHWLSFYGGNTHNAFLMLHAHYGIIPFVFILGYLASSIVFCVKNGRILIAISIGLLMFRSIFDWTSFPGIYDVLFYVAILIFITRKRDYHLKENGELL